MSLSNYSDLQSSVASWLHRSDLTSVIPDLVTLAEARIARDLRLSNQLATATLTCVSGTNTVAVPNGFLEFENLTLNTDPTRALAFVSYEYLTTKYDEGYVGIPVHYTIAGTSLVLGPTPDAAYTITASYYKRLDPLASVSTNWLLTNHPGVYLFGTLAEAAPFMQNDERTGLWESKYAQEVARLQDADQRAQYSGSALRVKAL